MGVRIDVLQLAPDYDTSIDARRGAVVEAVRRARGRRPRRAARALAAGRVHLPALGRGGRAARRSHGGRARRGGPRARRPRARRRRSSSATTTARLYNTSVLLGPDGSAASRPTARSTSSASRRASRRCSPLGASVVAVETPLGPARPRHLLRPPVPRAVPRRWSTPAPSWSSSPRRGRRPVSAHWSLLARARAVEDQVVVVAGEHRRRRRLARRWAGCSVVVDAQGAVLAEAGHGRETLSVEVDLGGGAGLAGAFPGPRRPAPVTSARGPSPLR